MNCPRFNKIFRGCKFKPRYSKSGALIGKYDLEVGASYLSDILEKTRDIKYEGDVCVRCGKFVKKES